MKKNFIKNAIQAGFLMVMFFAFGATANAQKGISLVKVVKFDKGSSAVMLDGSVKRGISNDFLITARRGQNASFYLEAGAGVTFTLISPDGEYLSMDETGWTGVLPTNGVYRVNVLPNTSTNRSKAYKLTVRITH